MTTFFYKAKNLAGELISGQLEADNYNDLQAQLSGRGYFVVNAQAKQEQQSLFSFMGKVTVKDLNIFCRQFAVLMEAGVNIIDAMSTLVEQTENRKLRDVLSNIHEDIQKGRMLSSVMNEYPKIFPDFMRSMIRIGEASGSLDMVLYKLAEYYEKDSKVQQKVKSAMVYPTILGILTVAVVSFLLIFILPMFASTLEGFGTELPFITKIIMGFSDFLVSNLIVIVIIVAAAITGLIMFKKTESGKLMFDNIGLKNPLTKAITLKTATARFARSMSILLHSGIPILNAIEIMSGLIGNMVIMQKFEHARTEIQSGRSLTASLKAMSVFPPLLVNMVAIGEESGELDDMLSRTAGFFDDEVEAAIQKLTTMIEPIMLIVMAAIIGTIIIAIMMPIVSLMNSIQ
ncbi:MAG: type secretory pathway, component PulF [Clostridia bacterium]|nr:type secretory pathway, component PulF [Clostridia bacterium]